MLLKTTPEAAFKSIGDHQTLHTETIIPQQSPIVSHSPYRVEYDWLFHYERALFRVLDPWLRAYRYEVIGDKGLLTEMLSNAYCHGHKRDPSLPIQVSVVLGKRGLIIIIEDTGQGFPVNKILEEYKNGKNYYHLAGNGIRRVFESRDFKIFYNQKGNIAYILYLF